jgi:hypothetical protein
MSSCDLLGQRKTGPRDVRVQLIELPYRIPQKVIFAGFGRNFVSALSLAGTWGKILIDFTKVERSGENHTR